MFIPHLNLLAPKMLFFLFFLPPKCWFRKLREVCRKKIHQVAPLKSFMVTSYDQKTIFFFFNNFDLKFWPLNVKFGIRPNRGEGTGEKKRKNKKNKGNPPTLTC